LYHLAKRNPDLSGVKGKKHYFGTQWLVQTAVNRTPPGAKSSMGDHVYYYETGYAIWGEGKIISPGKLYEYKSIEELLDHAKNITGFHNDVYWGHQLTNRFWPAQHKGKLKSFNIFEIKVDLKPVENPMVLKQDLKGQVSWRYLPGPITDDQQEDLKLDTRIPSALKIKLYTEYNIRGDHHYFDIDHVVPSSLGGPGNIEENLVPMAFGINRSKSNSVPPGLFIVAKGWDIEGGKNILSTKLLNDNLSKNLAKKIVSEAKRTLNKKDIRKFFSEIKRHSYPNLYGKI